MIFNCLKIYIAYDEFYTNIEYRKRLLLSFYHSLLSISQNWTAHSIASGFRVRCYTLKLVDSTSR